MLYKGVDIAMKRLLIIVGSLLLIACISALTWYAKITLFEEKTNVFAGKDIEYSLKKAGEFTYNSKINGDTFEVLVDDEWKEIKLKGINMGMGKPGVFPGEAGIDEKTYYRWLTQIGEMGANSLRVYTLHPPDFYNALKRYNDERETPIYLFHGVWIDEGPLDEKLDAFDTAITKEFQSEMEKIVDVIHGNADIKQQAGHSYGKYNADVSAYVIGWILGIEWNPKMVKKTNEIHAGLGDYNGKYVKTIEAAPFEHWLAAQFDYITRFEMKEYKWIRPLSFINWVTTDILKHPAEPNKDEDLVGIDPNVIHLKEELQTAGQFASYHVYPYYPDFLNFEEKYLNFVDHRGEKNNYAGYLKDLHEVHNIPILIAEFGVPSSRGLTHENPFGWNQGHHTEEAQGKIIKRLYEDILEEDMLGGLVFTWQDEWFKKTWNTMDYDDPERRPFWSNAQTNEQQYGLLSFDRNKIKIDGDKKDWKGSKPIYTGDNKSLDKLFMDHDERYLYFRLDVHKEVNQNLFAESFPMILLDVIPNQGNHQINTVENLQIENGVDFIINLNGYDTSSVLIDSYYDLFTYQYAYYFNLIEADENLPTNNSGKFQAINLALNQEIRIPSTNEIIPFSYYETGKLKHGNGNPKAKDYNSLADYFVNEADGIIEVRIPWLLLGMKDPSQREIMANIYGENPEGSEVIKGINVGVISVKEKQDAAGQFELIDALPKIKDNKMGSMQLYKWKTWDEPLYEERLKESYQIVKELFTDESK